MNRPGRLCLPPMLAVILIMAVAQAADPPQSATSDQRFTEWVSDDLGLCVQISDLPRHWASFSDGPLAKRLWNFPPLAAWREQNRGMLSAVRTEVERRTGVPPKALLTQLLSQEVLFAIWPPADLPGEKPKALVLAEAADGELMRRTLKALVAARKKADKWRGQTSLEVAGETFVIDAVMPDDEQSEFFVTSAGQVAMIATSEALLRDVLQRRADRSGVSSLASSSAYRVAAERLAPDAVAQVFINPRAWDAVLLADLRRKPPDSAEAHSQKAVVAAWSATDYVAGAVHLERDLNAELAWQWRANELPPALREVAASLDGTSSLAAELPGNALMGFAAHADLGRLVRLMIAREWKNARGDSKKQNESIFAWALVSGIGPEIAGYLQAPPVDQEPTDEHLPLQAVVAIETRPLEPGTGRPALVRQLEPLLHAWLSAAATAHNRQSGEETASIQTKELGDGEHPVTIATGLLPGHRRQELAYRVDKDDRLWLATSAGLLTTREGSQSLGANPLVDAQHRRLEELSGIAYLNLAGWRELVGRGREAVDFLWQDQRLDKPARERKYRELQAIVELADQLLLTSRIDSSTCHLSLSITADDR